MVLNPNPGLTFASKGKGKVGVLGHGMATVPATRPPGLCTLIDDVTYARI